MFAMWFKQFSITVCLIVLCSSASANTYNDPNQGEDTILIEKEVSQKVPYHKIARSIIKHFFKVDTRSLLTFGKGSSSNVIRSFKELSERTRYRVKVKEDEVELKLSINF